MSGMTADVLICPVILTALKWLILLLNLEEAFLYL